MGPSVCKEAGGPWRGLGIYRLHLGPGDFQIPTCQPLVLLEHSKFPAMSDRVMAAPVRSPRSQSDFQQTMTGIKVSKLKER